MLNLDISQHLFEGVSVVVTVW